MNRPASGFERLLEILDSLGIPYMVGGSLASSVHGIPREPEHDSDPPDVLRQCIRAGRMFNLIHQATGFKFDIYPFPEDPYRQTAFSRRALAELGTGRGEVSERQWSDVLDIVRVQRGLFDRG